jgi:hypothetical protein
MDRWVDSTTVLRIACNKQKLKFCDQGKQHMQQHLQQQTIHHPSIHPANPDGQL